VVKPTGCQSRQLRIWLTLLVFSGLTFLGTPVAKAYVLPGKQVLALMAEKRVAPKTLEVQQSVSQLPIDALSAAATTLQETLFFSYPDRFRAEATGGNFRRISIRSGQERLVVVNGQIQTGPPERFEVYKDILLLETRKAMAAYLMQLGVDLNRTGLGRFEDDYCFIVGALSAEERTPQLWVQKVTFRPLRLFLPPTTMSPQEGMLEIRFLDWGQVEGAAYPMRVQIFRKHQLFREMRVENLRVDPVLDPALFDTAGLRAMPMQAMPDQGPAPSALTPEPIAE
jgi:hypothetical protein